MRFITKGHALCSALFLLFGEEIKNIIASEGAKRKEKHEKMDKWMHRLDLFGFANAPLSFM